MTRDKRDSKNEGEEWRLFSSSFPVVYNGGRGMGREQTELVGVCLDE